MGQTGLPEDPEKNIAKQPHENAQNAPNWTWKAVFEYSPKYCCGAACDCSIRGGGL